MAMLRSRFLWQLCGAIAAIILVSTLVFAFVASTQVQEDARDNIRKSLRVQATILSHLLVPIIRDGDALSSAELTALTGDAESRITVIRTDGLVLADNREEPSEMDNHAHRPEVLQAGARGVGVSERYSQTVQHNMLYVAVRAESEGKHLGYVRVAVPLRSVEEQLDSLRNRIFMTGFVIAGIFLIVGFLMARKFTMPLVRMTEGATRIARGQYDLRLPEDRRDEIGDLSVALNRLARDTRGRFEELTDSRNQLAAVLSGLTEGVIAVDMEHRVVHINEAAKQMLNIRASETAALWEIVKIGEVQQAIDTCLSEQATVNSTVAVDGRNLDLSATLLWEDDGVSPAGAIVVLQDVTELLRLEQVRSDFVANASHELKTPISAIRGMVETIIHDPDMADDVLDQFVERIRKQALRLDNIVQDLLRLSRFDTRAGQLAFSRVDLSELMQHQYEVLGMEAASSGVTLKIDLPGDAVAVEGEREALEQMLANLVENAIKYNKDDGEVRMRLRTQGQMAVIEVQDDGIGIPEEEQERIFERFYRVDRARSREQGGTGLGLSIVKHIARSHKGNVTVSSKPNEGSVFTVRLPLAS